MSNLFYKHPRTTHSTRRARRQLVAQLLIALLSLSVGASRAAERSAQDIIANYVREGLQSNLSLQRETLDVERSQAALDAARARFFPELALAASYARSEGGRSIDLPLGNLVNPIYATLNQLLSAQGKPAAFGQIDNSSIGFLLPRNQDSRLTLRQPVYAPAIPAAVNAQKALLGAAEYARVALARRLKRDITVAWLNVVRSQKATAIYDSSNKLLQENLRVNESLLRNGKITQDQVLRARAELLATQQQLSEAHNLQSQAANYLNFLLNRPLDSQIETAAVEDEISHATLDLASLRSAALAARPELGQANKNIEASRSQLRVARSAYWPTLSLGVDTGIQGPDYQFGSGRNFDTISLLLNWKLFDAGGRSAQLHAMRASTRQAELAQDELAQQIRLEVQQALDNLNTSSDGVATAKARAEAARAAFRIASRKRDEGVINQVEFMDARNTLSSAELNLNLTRFELLARQADLDYATAAGSLPLNNGVSVP